MVDEPDETAVTGHVLVLVTIGKIPVGPVRFGTDLDTGIGGGAYYLKSQVSSKSDGCPAFPRSGNYTDEQRFSQECFEQSAPPLSTFHQPGAPSQPLRSFPLNRFCSPATGRAGAEYRNRYRDDLVISSFIFIMFDFLFSITSAHGSLIARETKPVGFIVAARMFRWPGPTSGNGLIDRRRSSVVPARPNDGRSSSWELGCVRVRMQSSQLGVMIVVAVHIRGFSNRVH